MKNSILGIFFLAVIFTFTGCAELNKLAQANKQQQKKPGQTQGTGIKVNPNGVRYKDNVFASSAKTVEPFANGVRKYGGGQQQLKMRIVSPQGDSENKRPAVIFCFGGGFATRVNTGMQQFINGFAAKGYVAVDIDYRLGFNDANGMFFCNGNPHNITEAAYRAAQDIRAAVKYLVANADRLGIDENKIFLGGISAGAIGALMATYTENDEVDAKLRGEWGDIDAVGMARVKPFKVAGVYCFSPAVFDMAILDKKGPPTFLIHGTNDNVLNIKQGVAFNCVKNPNFPTLYGSDLIYERLKSLGTCVQYTVVCGGQHDLGIPIPEHIDRASEFIYSVLSGKCNTGKDFTRSNKYSGGPKYPGCN
jgi:acetyl esterase/lipase